MSDSAVEPKRWEEDEVPPCTVAYHFTLLDVKSEFRYCCRGDKIHGAGVSIADQWNNDRYNRFRAEWSKNYEQQKALCSGCPHQEENIRWDKEIREYLKQSESEND